MDVTDYCRSDLATSPVTIIVGQGKATKTFHAPSALLTRSSSFFKNCLKPESGFLEVQDGVVRLPEIRVSTFAWWLQWALSSGADLRREGVNIFEDLTESGEGQESYDDVLAAADGLSSAELSDHEANKTGLEGEQSTEQAGENKTKLRGVEKNEKPQSQAPLPRLSDIIFLYQMSEYLGSEACCNDVIDEVARIADHYNTVPNAGDTHKLWSEEATRDPLRYQGDGKRGLQGLVLDLFAGKKTDKLLLYEPDSWSVSG